MKNRIFTLILSLLASVALSHAETVPAARNAAANANAHATHFRTVKVNGLDIFYREAGPKDAPVVLLLHGFPTSSQMFRELIPRLADRYHVIAPDYPGYGLSSMPDRKEFAYTFANLTNVVEEFTNIVGAKKYALYVMDYGAPIGYRLALRHPERVTALIVQNGNAYEEGLEKFWDPLKALWKDPSNANRDALRAFLKPDGTKWQYTHGVPDPTLVSPDAWMIDQIGLDRPGNDEIQLDLFYDYRTNVEIYPEFQSYFRKHQPPTLIVWGRNDQIFPKAGALPYKRDLKNVEMHLVDAGHFLLETNGREAAAWIHSFLDRNLR